MLILTNRSFRNLFSGRLISVFADAMIFYSLLKWIELQSGSSDSFTLFFIAYYLPVAIFGIPVGSWIEGRTLQKVMILSDALRVAMLCIFPLIMYFAPYQWTYLLLFVLSVLQLFFIPANQSLLPHVVSVRGTRKGKQPVPNGIHGNQNFRSNHHYPSHQIVVPYFGFAFHFSGISFSIASFHSKSASLFS